MKTRLFIFTSSLIFCFNTFGQNNPIENLSWFQTYENMHNLFQLNWSEPAQPHNELIGYNIYRNNEFYKFQTENTLYYLYTPQNGYVTNDSEAFLSYGDGSGFEIHVTAVYNPGQVESDYLQTVYSSGSALSLENFADKKNICFPNPTNGILNVATKDLKKITLLDCTGKFVEELAPNSQIDLGYLAKGVYIMKFYLEKEIIVEKVVIQ